MPEEISARELADRIREGKLLRIVDVREDWEREIGHLEGDVHIPMNEIPGRLADARAPEGGELVIYCHAGVRSMMVAAFLEQNGVPRALSLAGGIDAWSSEVDPRVPRY
jgi:rhodanese-related sulfurtransferase